MSDLIKVAHMEKQAFGAIVKALKAGSGLGSAIKGGIKGGTKVFDKNVYRPLMNITRPAGAKIDRAGWDAYRAANPAIGYKALGLGGLGYGGYQGYQHAGPEVKRWGRAIGDFAGDVGESIGTGFETFGRNVGKIGGTALPILAFMASRGKIRHMPGTLGVSAAGYYGGSKFDEWNARDAAHLKQLEEDTVNRIRNRQEFYQREGSSANSDDGSFSPNPANQYWSQELGRVIPFDRYGNPQVGYDNTLPTQDPHTPYSP